MKNIIEIGVILQKNNKEFQSLAGDVISKIKKHLPTTVSEHPRPSGGRRYGFYKHRDDTRVVLIDIYANGEIMFIERNGSDFLDDYEPGENISFFWLQADNAEEEIMKATESARKFLEI